jgi:hypothetical protein
MPEGACVRQAHRTVEQWLASAKHPRVPLPPAIPVFQNHLKKNIFASITSSQLAFSQLPLQHEVAITKTTWGVVDFYCLKVLSRYAYIDVQLKALNG